MWYIRFSSALRSPFRIRDPAFRREIQQLPAATRTRCGVLQNRSGWATSAHRGLDDASHAGGFRLGPPLADCPLFCGTSARGRQVKAWIARAAGRVECGIPRSFRS
jgi:hypothetical protein